MKKISAIHIIGIILLLLITAPIIYLLLQVFHEAESPLKPKLLWEYSRNTLVMVAVVSMITGFMGSLLAWIVTFYDFPFRKIFQAILALPLAIPPYIAAHSYADFTYYQGLLPRFLTWCGYDQYFDMMNFRGAIFIYCITLYPYVYLMALSFYRHSSAGLIHNGRVLGAGAVKLFFKVGLPMARLPMVAGVTLVVMELVSDFGVVDYFGVSAFSTAIYKTWHNYNDFYSAIRLSAILLIIILFFVLLEAFLRRRLRFFTGTKGGAAKRIPTGKRAKAIIYGILGLSVLSAFFIPMVQLLYNAHYVYAKVINSELLRVIGTTFLISGSAALVTVILALMIANFTAFSQNGWTILWSKLATMGYSVPGVIIGLSVLFTFIDLDRLLVPLYRSIGIEKKVLVLSTGVFVLLFAYVVRFLAISYNNIYSGYQKINPNLIKASYTLRQSQYKTFLKVEIPLMIPSLLTAFLLVFLEIVKELPITLMLKPYQVETLTGLVYRYLHNEQYTEASIPSLMIVFLGMVAVLFTMINREK